MTGIALKDLLEAGVHFGHQTKRWNPKMKAYIFGERNGIYIIDLAKTAKLFREAEQFTTNLAADGRTVLFVGTKRQAQDAVAEEAQRCGMFYVNQRWLGGLLTNFTTIQRSLARLRDLEAMETDGRYDTLSKKEIAQLEKEKRKLQKNLEGIRNMSRLPDALFVVDTQQGKDRRRRGAQAEDPGHRRRRHQLRSGRSGLRDPGQRRRAARDPAVRVAHRRRGHQRPRHPGVGAGRRQAEADADDRGRRGPRAPRQARPEQATTPLPSSRRAAVSGTPAGSSGRRFLCTPPAERSLAAAPGPVRAGAVQSDRRQQRNGNHVQRW